MKAKHILQSKGAEVFAVYPDDSISDAVSVLNEKNIGAVIVRDKGGEVVGILSERDVVRRLGQKGAEAMALRVSECMTADPFTCAPDETIDALMSKMTEKRIRHLPVTQEGRVIGVISIGDVVKRKIEETEREAAALKEYISS
ncbi:CBS domain-containing protein [Hyphococcus sp.]|uniref:CBS domain-containing protein n=1 Tax=Hyphococcus sp. TaxID=2038636 RepID=UPI00208AEE12|nr:MAG: histidine kinase [Marinicaulis sp.]